VPIQTVVVVMEEQALVEGVVEPHITLMEHTEQETELAVSL
tara:strand:- start:538 stop:660 length:123 start_codon:yes stop_codon:yes gene_type:complete